MRPIWTHRWDVSPAEAREIQIIGRRRMSLETALPPDFFSGAGAVAAVDVAYDAASDFCFAALVVWDLARLGVIWQGTHAAPSTFPYVPGLLSFREIPPLLPLFERLQQAPDLILCDGQGLAHPRRFGLACHLGVIFDCPSLGWAKSRLLGRHLEPSKRRGNAVALKIEEEQVGWAFRSRENCRLTFVSPGHRISIKDSLRAARVLSGRHRLSEPAREAHRLTAEAMWDYRRKA